LEGALAPVRPDEGDALLGERRQGHSYRREVRDKLSVIVSEPDKAPNSLNGYRALLLLYCPDFLGVDADTPPYLDDKTEVLDALDLELALVDIDL